MVMIEYQPSSKFLQQYIHSIYFTKGQANEKIEFIYYPHYIETINIFWNASIRVEGNEFDIKHKKGEHNIVLSSSKTKFMKATVQGAYNVIGFHLKPMGVHHFFERQSLHEIDSKIFEISGSKSLKDIDPLKPLEEQLKSLEKYLLDNYRPSPDDQLSSIINQIHETNGTIKLSGLETQENLSRRTILRKFQKYLFCSFENYKKIVRFRQSILNSTKHFTNNSQLLDQTSYYDQSDFIHQFKSLTGETPNKLLRHIKNKPHSINYFWKL